jgi:hypothetical protein
LGWAKRGEDEGECEGETNRDFAHGFFLFARGKDGFSAKKKFTPMGQGQMDLRREQGPSGPKMEF